MGVCVSVACSTLLMPVVAMSQSKTQFGHTCSGQRVTLTQTRSACVLLMYAMLKLIIDDRHEASADTALVSDLCLRYRSHFDDAKMLVHAGFDYSKWCWSNALKGELQWNLKSLIYGNDAICGL